MTVILILDRSAVKEVSSGQVARLEIAETISNSGYWLPTTALIQGGRGLWSCYIIGEPAEVESFTQDANQPFRVERRDVALYNQAIELLLAGLIVLFPNS